EREIIEPHRALPAAAGGDGDLDGRDVAQLAGMRAPRERDLALLGRERLPPRWKREAPPVAPPHIVAARIDQLELEVVRQARALDREPEPVVGGKIDLDFAAGHGIPAAAAEIES